MTRFIKDFVHFVRTQGVAGFAVGFIIGRAVSDLVGSFVNDIINPVIGLTTSRFGDLASMSVTVSSSTIGYGKFASLLINFIIIAAVVYVVFKVFRFDRLDKPKQ